MRYSGDGKSFTILRKLVTITLLVLVCCCALAAGLFCLYYPGYKRLREINHKVEDIRASVERIEHENKELAERVRRLSTPAGSPLHIERVARQKIGLVKDGETVYYVKRDDQR